MTAVQESVGMKFRCAAAALHGALNSVGAAVSARATIPALSCVRVKASDGVVSLFTTDTEMSASATVKADVASGGVAVVSHERLLGFLAGSTDDVAISAGGGRAVVTSGGARLSMACLADGDFPRMDGLSDALEFSIRPADIASAIGVVKRAMSSNRARYTLCGVLWKSSGDTLETVAVDGKRLAQAFTPISGPSGIVKAIIPSRMALEMESLASREKSDALTVRINANGISVAAGGIELRSRLVEGEFPAYEAVIPKNQGHVMVIGAAELASANDKASLCSEAITRAVRLSISSGKVVLESANQSADYRGEVGCDYSGSGVEVILDHQLLRDALEAIGGGRARIGIMERNTPVLIEPESGGSQRQVVMPRTF